MKDHDYKKSGAEARRLEQRISGEDKKDGKSGIDCRCKEAEGKTISQMLKIVVKDLAFWKKDNQ